jgi:hypothetical protein
MQVVEVKQPFLKFFGASGVTRVILGFLKTRASAVVVRPLIAYVN